MTSPYEDGNPDAKICILGEAPARVEMRQGKPLVGPSGELLERCMHSAKIVRRECYLLNVFETEVFKKREGKLIVDGNGEELWTSKDGLTELGIERSKASLERLKACKANVIVPLGNTALSILYGDSRITKWRGSILEARGRKIVPTIHPAASLRGNYLWRHLIISDLDRAKKESKSPDLNLPQRELIIDPSYQDVLSWLGDIKRRVAWDIEALNHQVSCISFAASRSRVMSIPLLDEWGKHRWMPDQELTIWLEIARILGDPGITKLGMNLIFDIGFILGQMGIHTRGPIQDIMIAQHVMYPDFPKGLDFICSMHTREPYYKDDGKMWARPWNDMELFWQYNCKDSAGCFAAWDDELGPALERDGYLTTYNNTIELFPIILYMQLRGIKVDRTRLEETKHEVEAAISAKELELEEAAEYPFNPASPKQCVEYFYVTKGITPYISRTTGRPTTDDKAMSRIFRRYNLKEAKLVQEIRALSKLLGTYLEVEFDRDSRVRCSYNPRGTTTGRLSSSQTIFGTGMNLQNLHPGFKGFLVADNDCTD